MSLAEDKFVAGIKGIKFNPKFYKSKRYKVWQTTITATTCKPCFDLNGKIFLPENAPPQFPKLHKNCACVVVWLQAIKMGTTTFEGLKGIDVLISKKLGLPKQYITKKEAKRQGWKPILMNLWDITECGIIGGDIYKNKDGKLPSAAGRIWYEADINYTGGIRNGSRIVYSNDGLMFVTYDHYFTFTEIY